MLLSKKASSHAAMTQPLQRTRRAIQIEQIKQQTEKQKNDAMNQLKAQELQMKDQH